MNQKTAKIIRREINSIPIKKGENRRHRYLLAKDIFRNQAKLGNVKKYGTIAMVKSIKALLSPHLSK